MLSKRIPRRVALTALLALAGCGLTPAYAPGGPGLRWQNTVAIDAPYTVIGFRMGTHLTEVLGQPTDAQYTLTFAPKSAPVPATITEAGDITRFNLTGNAAWTLTDANGVQINEGLAQTFTSYAATGTTVATQTAETAALDRLAVALADLIVQQLLTTP